MAHPLQEKLDSAWDDIKTPVVNYDNFRKLPADTTEIALMIAGVLSAQTNIDDLRSAEFDWDYSKQYENTAGSSNWGWAQSHPTLSHAYATLANNFATYALKAYGPSSERYCYLARSDYFILKQLLEDIDGTSYEQYSDTVEAVLDNLRTKLCNKDPQMLIETIRG